MVDREVGIAGDLVLDLSHLAGLHQLEELRITYAGAVQSVRPLLDLPSLRDVRLRGTRILDPDETPLERLRETAEVLGPDE